MLRRNYLGNRLFFLKIFNFYQFTKIEMSYYDKKIYIFHRAKKKIRCSSFFKTGLTSKKIPIHSLSFHFYPLWNDSRCDVTFHWVHFLDWNLDLFASYYFIPFILIFINYFEVRMKNINFCEGRRLSINWTLGGGAAIFLEYPWT